MTDPSKQQRQELEYLAAKIRKKAQAALQEPLPQEWQELLVELERKLKRLETEK